MKTWLIWIQDPTDGYTWLEEAWTDDQTAENNEGWQNAVQRCRALCAENRYEMRVQAVNIPGAVELFDIPEVTAEVD